MKLMKLAVLSAVLLIFKAPALAGTACATPTVVPPDGRIVDFDFVAASTSNFYQFNVTANRSYSVEVRQDYDDLNTDITDVGLFTDAGCTAPVAGLVDTSTTEPALPANSFRRSFTTAASGTIKVRVTHNGGTTNGRYISVKVSETTVYNPNWSTFGTFLTQYNFLNTTSQAINGRLTVTPTVGSSLTPRVITFVIPANGQVGRTVGPGFDANVPVSHAGFTIFTHDGPPGSLLTQAQFLNTSATVIVPTKFETVRQSH